MPLVRSGAHDVPRLAGVAPVVDDRVGRRVVPAQVHLDDGVPLLRCHLGQGAVAQDPRVVDERIQPAELAERGGHDRLRVVDLRAVAEVQDGGAARCGDLVDDGLTGLGVDLTHDDARPLTGQLDGFTAAQAASSAGDDRDLALEESHERAIYCRCCTRVTASPRAGTGAPALQPRGRFPARKASRHDPARLHRPTRDAIARRRPVGGPAHPGRRSSVRAVRRGAEPTAATAS